mgnify:CR=1 FL=1
MQEEACRRRHVLRLILGSESPPPLISYPFVIPHRNDLIDEQSGGPLFPHVDYTGGVSRFDIPRLSDTMATFLIESFPSVDQLEVHRIDLISTAEVENLFRLLRRWCGQLRSLKITTTRVDKKYISLHFETLIELANKLEWPMLKHISLPYSRTFAFDGPRRNHQHVLDLEVLAKVEDVELYVEQGKVNIYTSLSKYGAGEMSKLRSLALQLGDLAESEELWRWYLTDVSREALQKITVFRGLPNDFFNHNCTLEFFTFFCGLQQVDLRLVPTEADLPEGTYKLKTLIEMLRPLTKLIYIRLSAVDVEVLSSPTDFSTSPYHNGGLFPSVKSLSLSVATPYHSYLLAFHLDHLFPSLQVFEYVNERFNCYDCKNFPFETRTQLDECLRLQMVAAVGGCHGLRKMYTPKLCDYEDEHRLEWDAKELFVSQLKE